MKQKYRYFYFYESPDGETGQLHIVAYTLKQAKYLAFDYRSHCLGCCYYVSGPTRVTEAPASMPLGVHGCDDFRNYKD